MACPLAGRYGPQLASRGPGAHYSTAPNARWPREFLGARESRASRRVLSARPRRAHARAASVTPPRVGLRRPYTRWPVTRLQETRTVDDPLVRGGPPRAATARLALRLLAGPPARPSAEPWPQTLPGAEAQAAESARAGRFAEAIALSTPLLEAEPERRIARIVRALAYYETGEPTRALADVDYYLDPEDDGTRRTPR